jgi:hypothetical protein
MTCKSPILAMSAEIDRLIGACAELDARRGPPGQPQWSAIDYEVNVVLQRVCALQDGIASLSATTMAEALAQMVVMKNLLELEGPDITERCAFIAGSVTRVLERELRAPVPLPRQPRRKRVAG